MPTHEHRKAGGSNVANANQRGGVRAMADLTSTARTLATAGSSAHSAARTVLASSHAFPESPGLPPVTPLPPIPQVTRSTLPAGAAAPTLVRPSQARTTSTHGSGEETSKRSLTDVREKDATAVSGGANWNMAHVPPPTQRSFESHTAVSSAPSESTPEVKEYTPTPTQDTHTTGAMQHPLSTSSARRLARPVLSLKVAPTPAHHGNTLNSVTAPAFPPVAASDHRTDSTHRPPKLNNTILKRITKGLGGARSSSSLRPAADSSGASGAVDGPTIRPSGSRNKLAGIVEGVREGLNEKAAERERERERVTSKRRAEALQARGLLPASRRYSYAALDTVATYDPFAAPTMTVPVQVERAAGVDSGSAQDGISAAEAVVQAWRTRNVDGRADDADLEGREDSGKEVLVDDESRKEAGADAEGHFDNSMPSDPMSPLEAPTSGSPSAPLRSTHISQDKTKAHASPISQSQASDTELSSTFNKAFQREDVIERSISQAGNGAEKEKKNLRVWKFPAPLSATTAPSPSLTSVLSGDDVSSPNSSNPEVPPGLSTPTWPKSPTSRILSDKGSDNKLMPTSVFLQESPSSHARDHSQNTKNLASRPPQSPPPPPPTSSHPSVHSHSPQSSRSLRSPQSPTSQRTVGSASLDSQEGIGSAKSGVRGPRSLHISPTKSSRGSDGSIDVKDAIDTLSVLASPEATTSRSGRAEYISAAPPESPSRIGKIAPMLMHAIGDVSPRSMSSLKTARLSDVNAKLEGATDDASEKVNAWLNRGSRETPTSVEELACDATTYTSPPPPPPKGNLSKPVAISENEGSATPRKTSVAHGDGVKKYPHSPGQVSSSVPRSIKSPHSPTTPRADPTARSSGLMPTSNTPSAASQTYSRTSLNHAPPYPLSPTFPALSPTMSTATTATRLSSTSTNSGSVLPRTPSVSSHGHSPVRVLDVTQEEDETEDAQVVMESDIDKQITEKEFGVLAGLGSVDEEDGEFASFGIAHPSHRATPRAGVTALQSNDKEIIKKRSINLFGRRRNAKLTTPTIVIPQNNISSNGALSNINTDPTAGKPRNRPSLKNLRRTVTSVTAGLTGARQMAPLSSMPTPHGEKVSNARTPRDLSPLRSATLPVSSPRSVTSPSVTNSLSPTSSSFLSAGSQSLGVRARAPPLSPRMHSRGSILIEANTIEDEESRRLSELAFLDF